MKKKCKVSQCWVDKSGTFALSHSLTHSQPAAISQSDDTPFGIPRQCKNKKKRIGKNINKNKRIQRFQTNQHQQQLRRVGGSRRACAGCTHSPRLWLVCLSLACVTSSLWTPHPTPPPLYICTVIAKRPFHLYLCSLSVSPSPSLSLSFFRELSDEERAHIEIRFEFNSNRCTLLIYQHFCGICDAFLRNYLCIIRLFEIFVSSTHSITLRYLCLHGPFLCLIECVSISYLFGEYLPRIQSHKRVLRSSCLA